MIRESLWAPNVASLEDGIYLKLRVEKVSARGIAKSSLPRLFCAKQKRRVARLCIAKVGGLLAGCWRWAA
jgi:hypothetical protein